MRPPQFKGNVIVWNVPEDFAAADLASLFDEHGLVLGATIKHWPDEPGRNPRGLVDLAPDAAVERAVAALDGTVIQGHKLKVRRAQESEKTQRAAAGGAGAERRSPRPVPRQPEAWAAPKPAAERPKVIVEYRTRRRLTGGTTKG